MRFEATIKKKKTKDVMGSDAWHKIGHAATNGLGNAC